MIEANVSDFIKQFAEKAFSTTEPFSLAKIQPNSNRTQYFHYIQDKIYDVRYIYGEGSLYNENFHTAINIKYNLAAIVVKDTIYIVNSFALCALPQNSLGELPAKVEFLQDVTANLNTYAKQKVFPAFYDSLETKEILEEDLRPYRSEARRQLLLRNPGSYKASLEDSINDNTTAKALCGLVDIDAVINRQLEDMRAHWIEVKARETLIEKLMAESDIISDWEIELANALEDIDDWSVTVEFTVGGRKAYAEIITERLLQKLIDRDTIDVYDFIAGGYARQFLEAFAGQVGIFTPLGCEHITKVTYRDEVLYTKETSADDSTNKTGIDGDKSVMRCENCRYCKQFQLHKRTPKMFMPFVTANDTGFGVDTAEYENSLCCIYFMNKECGSISETIAEDSCENWEQIPEL